MEQLEQEEKKAVKSKPSTIYELKTEPATDISEIAKALRNACLVTLIIAIGIIITTSSGSLSLGFHIKPPIKEGMFHFILASIAVFYGGSFFFVASWQAIRKRTANAAILISIGVLVAYMYSIATTFFVHGESLFGMATLLLNIILLGYWIETVLWGKMTESIQASLENKPKMVNLMMDRLPTVVPINKVEVGDILLVRPGERVPVDGVITDGRGLLDESPINSDPHPRQKSTGDVVIGGSKNEEGTFHMRVLRLGSDSTITQMAKLIEGSQRTSTPLQSQIEIALPFLVLMVVGIGTVAFLVWYLVLGYRLVFALTVSIATVIATSLDALTLSVPVAVAIGAGIGLRQGILIKDAAAVDKAAHIETVVFDKISCLTEGDPQVTDIIQLGKLTKPGLLRLAASIEKNSDDRIAKAIIKVAEEQVGLGIPNPEKHMRVHGKGAMGELETRTIIVGNERMMRDNEINIASVEQRADELARKGKTVVYIAVDGLIEGVLGVTDKLREDAKESIKQLHGAGIEVAMITGDDYRTATGIAAILNIDKVYADTLPENKAEKLVEIQRQGLYVAMIGNGVKDADVLEHAYLGIAVTDSANLNVKSGSIILARNNPFDILNAIALSKIIVGKVRQNMGWAVGYNLLAISVAAGILYPLVKLLVGPELAALAMSASTLIVMGNSLLLKRNVIRED